MNDVPKGWITHDGTRCPFLPWENPLAVYRRDPTKPVKLLLAGMERWNWAGKESDPLDIVAYCPDDPL